MLSGVGLNKSPPLGPAEFPERDDRCDTGEISCGGIEDCSCFTKIEVAEDGDVILAEDDECWWEEFKSLMTVVLEGDGVEEGEVADGDDMAIVVLPDAVGVLILVGVVFTVVDAVWLRSFILLTSAA